MQPLKRKRHVPPEEYLEFERAAVDRHEYFNGEIFAMADSSFEHAIIASNIEPRFIRS